MFQLHTTPAAIVETMYWLGKKHVMLKGKVRAEVQSRIEKSLDEVIVDYDPAIPFPYSDQDDRHVHAGAIAGRADILLTADTGIHDLPQADKDRLPYEIYSPDEFFMLIERSSPMLVRAVTDRQREYWATRKRTGGLQNALEKAKCPQFALAVRDHLVALSGVKP